MLRIAVVEDETQYKEQLVEYLHRFEQDKNINIEIETYSDGDGIVENYQAQFDIILMDVQMKFMDGMSAAEEIRKVDSEVVIIFITNMPQFAIKGYAVDALDYILKPISYFQFSERLKRAMERMERRETNYITIRVKEGIKRLKVSDIYYIENQGHNLIFNTKEDGFITSGAMKDLEEELSSFNFFRGHRGFLMNLEHVEGLKGNNAIVREIELPVGRTRRKSLLEALSQYWGETIK